MRDIVIIGGGGHAKVIVSILKKLNTFNILGFTDTQNRGDLLGIPFLGDDTFLKRLSGSGKSINAVVGLGMLKSADSCRRKRLFDLAGSLGYVLSPIISPDAMINEDVSIGKGTIVMDGVVVNSGSVIGDGVILNTHCSIDHDCRIGNFSHIAPSASLCGGVVIQQNVLVGSGAVIIENKNISVNSNIGAGAVVIKDCAQTGTYVGNPAKRIK